MTEPELLPRLALALAIGLMIGVERGWRMRADPPGSRVAGIRTFALVGLLGGVWAALGSILGEATLGLAFAALAGMLIVARLARLRTQRDFGLTTDIAALLTFALGALAVRVDMTTAAAAGVVTVALLDVKDPLHNWLTRIEHFELMAAIRLALISVVILPVLPDRGFGPGGVINPYILWWMVVLIAAISFIGYFAVRLAGARVGLIMTGVFAGLASSTALTVSFARTAHRARNAIPVLSAGVAAATGMMFVRLLVVVLVISQSVGQVVALPFVCAGLVAFLGAYLVGRKPPATAEPEKPALGPPLELSTALLFGALLATITVLVYFARTMIGDAGVYGLAALSALVDVDAIALSLARAAENALALNVAAGAITLAAFVNTAWKVAIAGFIGGRDFALAVTRIIAPALLAGVVALFWLFLPIG